MTRHFIDHPNGRCFWAIVSEDGVLLQSRTSQDRKGAERESAHHMKLFSIGKHYREPGIEYK